jgi:hypothetical protein
VLGDLQGHVRRRDPHVARGIGREFGGWECADFRECTPKYRGFGVAGGAVEQRDDRGGARHQLRDGKNLGIRRFTLRSPGFAVAHPDPHQATAAMPQSSVLRKAVSRIHRQLAHGRRCATIDS